MFANALDEAKTLIMRGDYGSASQCLGEFLNGEFYHDEALFMLGSCYIAQGMNGLGAVLTSAAYDVRAAQQRKFPEALMNLGAAYKAEHKNDIAEKIWQDALRQETLPRERAKILTNLAGLYVGEGQPTRAIDYCDKALIADPNCHGAHANRGMACLELRRWREGWDGWRHTYATGDRTKRSYGAIQDWDGSPGKTLIVWGDQGIGDEIFYASCFADLQRRSKRLILDCHPRLSNLFERSFPEFIVHGTRKDLTDLPWLPDCGADAAVAMADVFSFLRNTDAEWGNGEAYLKPNRGINVPALSAAYRSVNSRPMRIGLSWTGGTKRTRTDLRSLPLLAMRSIVEARPDAHWFSLQYTPNAAREVCDFEEQTGIRIAHYPGWVECFDYDRTASFVASLDLIITVCTTVHHLGGALGVPTWTLVPSRPSWRYTLQGESLPWYASAKLFRQDADNEWSGIISRVADELADI